MNRSIVALALMLLACAVRSQDGSLTKDFEKLSARERARIAREEQEAAQRDAAYQMVMSQAESLFQRSRYEESMEKFQEARGMRPYNVYPKVKIQDLKALIAKRDAEQAATDATTPLLGQDQGQVDPAPQVAEPHGSVDRSGPVQASGADVGTAMGSGPGQVVVATPTPVLGATGSATKEKIALGPPVNDRSSPVPSGSKGTMPSAVEEGERVYKEGRSVVVEQRIAEEGRVVVYRKVSHPWGQIDHFRDGVAVTGRVYEKALEGR